MMTDAITVAPYADLRQYLTDQLRLLDYRISTVLQQRTRHSSLPGLVISDTDLAALMDQPVAFDDRAAVEPFIGELEARSVEAAQGAAQQGIFLPLPELAVRFGLSRLEMQMLVVCLAPEIDRKYEKLYGYLHDDITSRRPTVGLGFDLMCESPAEKVAARALFDADAPLIRFGLLEVEDPQLPLIARPMKLDDRMTDYLLGVPRSHGAASRPRSFDTIDTAPAILMRLRDFLGRHTPAESPDRLPAVVHLWGPHGAPVREVAEAACTELGIALLTADLERLGDQRDAFDRQLRLLVRDATLLDAALCLERADSLFAGDGTVLRSVLEATAGRLTFVTGNGPWRGAGVGQRMLADIELPLPGVAARQRSWTRRLGEFQNGTDTGSLAAKFHFTEGQIDRAVGEARCLAWWNSPEDGRPDSSLLHTICRRQSTPKLGALAKRIDGRRQWSDLVLSPDSLRQLGELCNQARYRDVVYGEWGFDQKLTRGKGLNALFCGSPGSGKTLAAEVTATALGLDLYKVDLSQVVSKFVGETEKQLRQVFDEAQGSDVILFFDEADALFGKRSEVKDAHDRYANIEIGYLLQRMEEYDGISIMATNLHRSLDDAFVRRLQFIVEFRFPEASERELIWKTHLPPELPLAADVDLRFLATAFKLSGGYIRNIVVGAAFQAAAEGTVLGMKHIVRAVQREFQKMGRTCSPTEFGPYAHLRYEDVA